MRPEGSGTPAGTTLHYIYIALPALRSTTIDTTNRTRLLATKAQAAAARSDGRRDVDRTTAMRKGVRRRSLIAKARILLENQLHGKLNLPGRARITDAAARGGDHAESRGAHGYFRAGRNSGG